MRIHISADMEGITGLVGADDVQPGGRDYERGRSMMAEDVNAAVRGAVAAGATDIVVNDAHGPMRNLLPEALHPAARLIRGRPKQMGMLEGLTREHDAMICVGYHARAGALGVLSHSFMGHEIEDMWLDGRPVGEIGLAQATAATLGVPLVALTGDDAACAEATAWDDSITTVPVKYAHDRFAAELRPAAEARQAIEEAVTAALSAVPEAPLVPANPRTLTVRWQSASVASTLLGIPGVTTPDSRTAEAHGELPALYRLFGVWMRVAASLGNQPPYC
ncbi:peptidase M55 [Streptomyces avermitilis]|uniref:D-aminopeptidase (Family M55 peptidases ) n=2 Tax=Streptomyces avermitilis TaxID=33903 RepID=Q82P22_STRAW|nr:M55 family metallopeptidase [Streptomyces avermitilis]MYS96744.1 peptidase M55 [Streptomyces sp. SID5469]KUN54773.1 peptidase M55 [Streptomyces avermitilis]OOV21875.1 peptidase M55 [Streptomyces avermitilis]BAC68821.1 putative D-aminopeptidase (family M55 peptidases) [Streptomyces avermitilis MA-4680 = NBRC 14893]BBJ48747.1 transporter [Streptomyces avermitilis]